MKEWPLFTVILALGLCPLVALNLAGCKSSDDDDDDAGTNTTEVFTITPQDVTLVASNTPSQTFTAGGGTPAYAWSVQDTALGSLNTTIGDEVKYTATTNTGTNIVRAEDGEGRHATAVVTQQ